MTDPSPTASTPGTQFEDPQPHPMPVEFMVTLPFLALGGLLAGFIAFDSSLANIRAEWAWASPARFALDASFLIGLLCFAFAGTLGIGLLFMRRPGAYWSWVGVALTAEILSWLTILAWIVQGDKGAGIAAGPMFMFGTMPHAVVLFLSPATRAWATKRPLRT